jgi:dolichol-phosphate mannosyltransferase
MMLSVVVPVLNEERNVPEMANRVRKVLDADTIDWELIFIDDGSTDSTPWQLAELNATDARIKAVHLSRNFGHQAAISLGLRAAAGDAVVVMDGDLQDPPEMLPEMLARWREGNDVVYAVRVRRSEGWLKRASYRIFYRLLTWMSRVDMPLDSGDFSLMSRRVVDVINAMPERTRFMRGMRSWTGFRQVGVAQVRGARHAGEAKYTLRKLIRLALDGFIASSYRPLQLASLFGVFVSFTAMLLAVGLITLKLTHGIPLVGWTSLIVAILFMGGVQLVSLGILGEYVGRIYEESRGRPTSVVARISGDTRLPGPGAQGPAS